MVNFYEKISEQILRMDQKKLMEIFKYIEVEIYDELTQEAKNRLVEAWKIGGI